MSPAGLVRMVTVVAAVTGLGLAPRDAHRRDGNAGCSARDERQVAWTTSQGADRHELDRWCNAVGPPIYAPVPTDAHAVPVRLADLVVVTWNTHLAEGDLEGLIADLRRGRWTDGQPVTRFVLLLQELFRRGPDVPPFAADARSAFAITARNPRAIDAAAYARTLGLAMLYVPSMRNGAEVHEDRGNAIVSSEPLAQPVAVELPLERQRRVAVGATVTVDTGPGEPLPLRIVNAHLEPLSSPRVFWVFQNPRRRQVGALLDALGRTRQAGASRDAGVVIGGDFNTIQGGAAENVYAAARQWSRSLGAEDGRSTHAMGRLDYLFFNLTEAWTANTKRIDERYGSDHHPVLGRFVSPK